MSDNITCTQCGGRMKKTTKAERNLSLQFFGIIVFIIGLAMLFLFPIGTIIGILLMLAALGMGYKKKKIWKCEKCGYFFERS